MAIFPESLHLGHCAGCESGYRNRTVLTGGALVLPHGAQKTGKPSRAQKLDLLTRLSGIAHDLNNLLTMIIGNTELLLDPESSPEERHELAKETLGAALTGAAMGRRLVALSRRKPLEGHQREDLSKVLSDLRRMLTRILGKGISLNLALADDLLPVALDRLELETAIINLVLNAKYAMPRGGQIRIATRNESDASGGAWATIEITDTGVGMPAEVLARAEEPYFSTRSGSGGLGLGLPIVRNFVMRAGGSFGISSEPGAGTTVRMAFPAVIGVR